MLELSFKSQVSAINGRVSIKRDFTVLIYVISGLPKDLGTKCLLPKDAASPL